MPMEYEKRPSSACVPAVYVGVLTIAGNSVQEKIPVIYMAHPFWIVLHAWYSQTGSKQTQRSVCNNSHQTSSPWPDMSTGTSH